MQDRISTSLLRGRIEVEYPMVVFSNLTDDRVDIILVKIPSLHSMTSKENTTRVLTLVLHVWGIENTALRTTYWDNMAMYLCAEEIVLWNRYEKGKWILEWCHRIQNDLSNADVKKGWRASYTRVEESDHFFYLNEKIKERKQVKFYNN